MSTPKLAWSTTSLLSCQFALRHREPDVTVIHWKALTVFSCFLVIQLSESRLYCSSGDFPIIAAAGYKVLRPLLLSLPLSF